ncbi:MAG: 4Fe-4S binding protein [Phycisphaerae bacterium]|nr:4Fe-4S binding protein [Phycisphaerae bacterium]
MSKMIVSDPDRCLACKSCELACAMAHCGAGALAEAAKLGAHPQTRVHVEPCGRFGAAVQCYHCEDAPCTTVCPTEAITRQAPDDPVLLDQETCIGCKYCMLVCPFGAISISSKGKAMIKCDMCIERTSEGAEPACVAACPTGALKFEEINEWLAQRRRRSAEALRAAATTEP